MSGDPTTIPVTRVAPGSGRTDIMALLRRRRVAVGLLFAFTFLVGVVSQRLFSSLDEGYQWEAAQHPIPYIVTHDPQNQPFYGVIAHCVMRYFPRSPIAPVRLPAFIAGLLVPLVFYATHRRYAGHEAALWVAMVLVIIDPLRYYMSVGRGYSLVILGVLVLNHLVLVHLRRGGWWRPAVYMPVAVATCFTHLWAFPILGAHGVFLVLEVARRRGRGAIARRGLGMMAAVAASLLLGIVAYLPMLAEIRSVASRRGTTLMVMPIVNALLQLPRCASWTVAAFLLFVPIILEGFARRPLRLGRDRAARMYLLTIVLPLGWASLVHSVFFGSRYLLGVVPAAAGLIAWGMSAYWRGRESVVGRRLPMLARPATWTIGIALGVISMNAPIAHEIPCGVPTEGDGSTPGYYYRALARRIGDPPAVALLMAGIVGLVVTWRGQHFGTSVERTEGVATAYLWTGFLLVSMVPLVLGPAFSYPLFELHMIAVAAVLLDTWEYRYSPRHLRVLRPALVLSVIIAMSWQLNLQLVELTPRLFLGVAMYLPPILIVLPLVWTTAPAFADGRGR